MKEQKKNEKKPYMGFAAAILLLELLAMLLCIVVYQKSEQESGRLYQVEAQRVTKELLDMAEQAGGKLSADEIAAGVDLGKYPSIVCVSAVESLADKSDSGREYVVAKAMGSFYRIEYEHPKKAHAFYLVMIVAAVFFALTAVLLRYVWTNILNPFYSISELPEELAKGNLAKPVRAEKSKYFKRFLWGMDMLREKLEDNRRKELELQKEKQTLLLSLSHDIKTPLSAIELYAKALSEHLYDSQEKQEEVLHGIIRNATDIHKYIDEIAQASKEDFLNLEVSDGEFYLLEALQGPKEYYRDKLAVLHTDFEVALMEDCLVKGDRDRMTEILQNLMENAIKYGDGKWIHILHEEEEDCRLITVENSGCTLKPEELPGLFAPFYRGSNSNGVNGSGLGLYICRELIRRMDGDIYVRLEGDIFKATVVARKA